MRDAPRVDVDAQGAPGAAADARGALGAGARGAPVVGTRDAPVHVRKGPGDVLIKLRQNTRIMVSPKNPRTWYNQRIETFLLSCRKKSMRRSQRPIYPTSTPIDEASLTSEIQRFSVRTYVSCQFA